MTRYLVEAQGEAENLRSRLNLGSEALGDVFHLLEDLALLVVRLPLGDNGVDGLFYRQEDTALVLVNSSHPFGRQRFTATHELGHFVMDHAVLTVDEDVFAGRSVSEKRANAFAAHFLMPRQGVVSILDRLGARPQIGSADVVHLQKHFGVSYQATLWHLLNLGLISAARKGDFEGISSTRTALELGYRDMLRAEEAERGIIYLPPLLEKLAVRAYEQSKISFDRLCELLRAEGDAARAELAGQLEGAGITQKPLSIEEIVGDAERA